MMKTQTKSSNPSPRPTTRVRTKRNPTSARSRIGAATGAFASNQEGGPLRWLPPIDSRAFSDVVPPAKATPTKAPRKRRLLGQYQSLKSGGVEYDRQEQKDCCQLWEIDHSIRFFLTKPAPIQFRDGGVWSEHQADFLVEHRDGTWSAVDLWPQAIRPAGLAKLLDVYAERGITYRLLPKIDVQRQPRLDVARYLLRYKGVAVPETIRLDLVGSVARSPGIALGALEQQVFGDQRGRRFVLALVARNDLWLTTDAPVGPETRLWLTDPGVSP